MAEFYRARESFATPVGGTVRVVQEGTLVSDQDPLFKKCRDYLVPVAEFVERDRPTIETTTAVPGEKRSLTTAPPRGVKTTRKDTEHASPPAP